MALTLLRWYHNPIEHIFILVLELKKKRIGLRTNLMTSDFFYGGINIIRHQKSGKSQFSTSKSFNPDKGQEEANKSACVTARTEMCFSCRNMEKSYWVSRALYNQRSYMVRWWRQQPRSRSRLKFMFAAIWTKSTHNQWKPRPRRSFVVVFMQIDYGLPSSDS